jgi:hypothetical protein
MLDFDLSSLKDEGCTMKPGKFLEMVVDCLQRLLAPDGFSVTRNVKYYQNGQQIGEVDVLVQGRLGSEDVKIAIECRDRKGPQSRPWIREIIGKKIDLGRFGITHWMAVSINGFTGTAEKLARESGIIIIVPGEVTPLEPEKPGPHTWMNWALVEYEWNEITFKADLEHENDEILDYIERIMKDHRLSNVFVKVSNDTQMQMIDFLNKEIDSYCNENSSKIGDSFQKHNILLENLQGIFQGVSFNINHMEICVAIRSRRIIPKFRIMGFCIPHNKQIQVLAIIGINEYESHSRVKYLMVGFRSGDINNPIMVARDIEGNSIPNTSNKNRLFDGFKELQE